MNNWYVHRIGELNADIQRRQQTQIISLKANLTEQKVPSDAQEAVLEVTGLRLPSTVSTQ
ncbi:MULTISPECIES: hypothetical protein [Paraburkholderia]|uniref:hypothetical protein n=1 Tax=Paraburkholderia TaxID=1822464 RepID=UPI00036BB6E3|nr:MULTISPECIES: hypothetical protein [Paraburkholderia]MDH6148204.1 hypothetical protein [Paraburkholderia sp. WSM4179]